MNENFDKTIDSFPKKGNFITNNLLNKPYFLLSSEFTNSAVNENEVFFKSSQSNKSLLLIIGISCLIISLKFKNSLFYYPLLIFIALAMAFNFFYLKNKKVKTIKISDFNIEIENVKYEWSEIYAFGVMVNPNRYLTYYTLIIFSNLKGKKEHNLFSFQSQQDDIIKKMNYFREKYLSKNLT
ncbi:hypothetical protein [Flavobacterium chungnamense]|uniref:YcxB-like protein domain-containing protein n=1 Tax=Flavobacterium chungnamense TaxID=706182 RepID=A0ABP7USQ7_9FLAO